MDFLNPDNWPRPSGYSNGVSARGRHVYVAGQVGWDEDRSIVDGGIVAQVDQALANVVSILAAGNAKPNDIVRMTWYVTRIDDYRNNNREIGAVYRARIGRHFPTMTLVEVAGLLEPGAEVEIEVTAVVEE